MKKIVALCLVIGAIIALPATASARSHFSFSMNLFPMAGMCMPCPQPVVCVPPPQYVVPVYQQRTIVHEYHHYNHGYQCYPQEVIREEVRVCPPRPMYRPYPY